MGRDFDWDFRVGLGFELETTALGVVLVVFEDGNLRSGCRLALTTGCLAIDTFVAMAGGGGRIG